MLSEGIIILILIAANLICQRIAVFRFFRQKGVNPWLSLVPIYALVVWLDIIRKPRWLVIFFFVPGLWFIFLAGLWTELVKCYGRTKFVHKILAIIPGGFYMLYVTYKYKMVEATEGERNMPLKIWDWASPALAVLLAIVIFRAFMYEAYLIPTPAMEKTLLVGDYFFVSKLDYGARIPITPLAIPFYHHTFTPLGIKAYVEWIHLPYLRLPAFEKVKRNDLITFNWPAGDTVILENQGPSYYDIIRSVAYFNHTDYNTARQILNADPKTHIISRPVDKRENYVKRCVGIPGDKLEIRDGVLYINDKLAYQPENLYKPFSVNFKAGYELTQDLLDSLNVENVSNRFTQMSEGNYVILMTQRSADNLKSANYIASVTPFAYPRDILQSAVLEIFPNDSAYHWNIDNFGPVYLPKTGMVISLNDSIYPQYERAIRVYEANTVERKNGKFIINGRETETYTFKMNYYWMMGDNRHNSQDSRYWGFLPEDHILGKATIIWLSMDKQADLFHKIRWNRIFTSIHDKWAPAEKQFTE